MYHHAQLVFFLMPIVAMGKYIAGFLVPRHNRNRKYSVWKLQALTLEQNCLGLNITLP
jgi:hypothetical protein